MRLFGLNSNALLTAFLAAIVAGLVCYFNLLSSINTIFRDSLLRYQLLEYNAETVVIAIDEKSLDELGAWPWSRDYHAKLLEQLVLADNVVIDILFSEKQSDWVGRTIESPDSLLAQVMEKNKNVILPMYISERVYKGLLTEILPIAPLANAAIGIGHVHPKYDSDGIARGVYLWEGLGDPFWPHIGLVVKEKNNNKLLDTSNNLEKDNSMQDIQRKDYRIISFVGQKESIYHFSYIDVLRGAISKEVFRGKNVFVGATARGLGDDVPTVFGVMSGVEFNANVFETISQSAYKRELLPIINVTLVVLLTFFICCLLSTLSPLQFLTGAVIIAFFCYASTAFFFLYSNTWFRASSVVLGLVIFYPLWSLQKIRSALKYLQRELNRLKNLSEYDHFDDDLLVNHLSKLSEMGIIKEGGIKQIEEKNNALLWPLFDISKGSLVTEFIYNKKRFQLFITSDMEVKNIEEIARCLLGKFIKKSGEPRYSTELVEQTLEELYHAKAEAYQAEQRTLQSLEKLQDAVVVTNRIGQIIFLNEVFQSFFKEIKVTDFINSLQGSFQSRQWLNVQDRLIINHEEIYEELTTIKGVKLLCQGTFVRSQSYVEEFGFKGVEESIYIMVFTDVTQLRQLEQNKKEALAFLSHDMRSPIVSQLAAIEHYKNKNLPLDSDQNKLISDIEHLARKNLKYADDFLQLSKAESLSRQAFNLVDMHSVIDNALAIVLEAAKLKKIDLKVIRTELDCWIEGDVQVLERAVVNVLSNAVQYSPEGSFVELTLDLKNSSTALVSIKDSGPGIDEEALPHLFEPYFRVSSSVKANEKDGFSKPKGKTQNFGLGLSFVKTVITRHGGSIEVISPGKMGGVDFLFSLPLTNV